jgi:hypothetical protein
VDGLQNATCFDDAYISLRYAENLVDGHGLVYNVGEYVEGYTNFLWTVLVALFIWITPVEAPLLAVLGSMLAFAINLWVVWRISLKIAPPFNRLRVPDRRRVARGAEHLHRLRHDRDGDRVRELDGQPRRARAGLGGQPASDLLGWLLLDHGDPDPPRSRAVLRDRLGGGVRVWVRPAGTRSAAAGDPARGLLPMATYAAPL